MVTTENCKLLVAKRGYKLNIRYLISVAVKELFCRYNNFNWYAP